MRLTQSSLTSYDRSPRGQSLAKSWSLVIAIALFAGVSILDHITGAAPVQHLYYLPIILTALSFGRPGGFLASLTAILLYHLGNDRLLKYQHKESDIIQIVLFIAVGAVTAKLADDAVRLHRLATTDDLTGLSNLRAFEAGLVALVGSARKSRKSLSMLVLDLDHLKALNEKHGHLAGANAVRAVGKVIAENLPPNAIACRYGGDEFAIALPQREDRAEQIANRICEQVHAATPVLAGHAMPAGMLSISVGLASRVFRHQTTADTSSRDEQDGEALFRAADQALYIAKAEGRNCVYSLGADISDVSPNGRF